MSQPDAKKTRENTQKQANIDFDELLNAIKDVKIHGKSQNATAKAYNFKRPSLIRYLKRLDEEVPDITAISDADLIGMLQRYTHRAPPLTACGFFIWLFFCYCLSFY